MTRQTSIDVLRQIEAEGLLTKRRLEVYTCLFHHGPMTQMEAAKKTGLLDHSVTPRFAELERQGAIKTVGLKTCGVTGRTVLLWDVTGELPTKLEKPVRVSCKHCNGKGYHETQQSKLF